MESPTTPAVQRAEDNDKQTFTPSTGLEGGRLTKSIYDENGGLIARRGALFSDLDFVRRPKTRNKSAQYRCRKTDALLFTLTGNEDYTQLFQDHQALQTQNGALETERKALQTKYEQLDTQRIELQTEVDGLNKKLQSKQKELETKVNALNKKLQTKHEQKTKLQTKLQTKHKELQELQSKQKELETKVNRLNKEMQTKHEQQTELQTKHKELQTEFDVLERGALEPVQVDPDQRLIGPIGVLSTFSISPGP